MDGLVSDIHFALRSYGRTPGPTAIAVLTLSLGIAAATALYGITHAVLVRALPYEAPEQLMLIWDVGPGESAVRVPTAPARFSDLVERNHVFAGVAAYRAYPANLTTTDNPELLRVGLADARLFPLLGVSPSAGRLFTAAEDQPGNDGVALLGYELWQRRYGGALDILGTAISLEGREHIVIGVLPRDAWLPEPADVWIPLAVANWPSRAARGLRVVARTRAGIDADAVRADLDAVAATLEASYPDTDRGWGMIAVPLRVAIFGNLDTVLATMLGSVGLLLLIACANVANLLLVRGSTRTEELAVRRALGATRRRLVAQLVIEALLLALVAAAIGIIAAVPLLPALLSMFPDELPRAHAVRIDVPVVLVATALSSLTALVFGVLPAMTLSHTRRGTTLRGHASAFAPRRAMAVVAAGEIALALILVLGAALLANSLARLGSVDPGFETDAVFTARLRPSRAIYRRATDRQAYYQAVLESLWSQPGVIAAGAVSHLPLSGRDETFRFRIQGRSYERFADLSRAEIRAASPGYFETLSIDRTAGRSFRSTDVSSSTPVAMVNEALVRQHFATDPLQQRISISGPEGPWMNIVGVIKDVRHFGLDAAGRPEIYLPLAQEPWPEITLAIEADGEPATLAALIRDAVQGVDDTQPLAELRPLRALVAESVAPQRFAARLSGSLAGLALLLAAGGIYGTLSHAVAQRRHEIGIRMAIGATGRDIGRIVARQSALVVGFGLVTGALGARLLARFLQSLLFQTDAADPATLVISIGVIVASATLASAVPAMRAARCDPAAALRRPD